MSTRNRHRPWFAPVVLKAWDGPLREATKPLAYAAAVSEPEVPGGLAKWLPEQEGMFYGIDLAAPPLPAVVEVDTRPLAVSEDGRTWWPIEYPDRKWRQLPDGSWESFKPEDA